MPDSSRQRESDGEGGEQRRTTHPDDAFDRVAEYEGHLSAVLVSCAEKNGAGFTAQVENLPQSRTWTTLLRDHEPLRVWDRHSTWGA